MTITHVGCFVCGNGQEEVSAFNEGGFATCCSFSHVFSEVIMRAVYFLVQAAF